MPQALSPSPSAPMPITEATALSWSPSSNSPTIGSRIPSTMKLSGLYSATVAAGSSIRFAGKNARGEEEHDEDEREQPLDDARLAAVERDRGGDAAEGERRGGDQQR